MTTIQQVHKGSRSLLITDLLVVLRIVLGLCLFIKGFSFMRNSAILENLLAQTGFHDYASGWVLFITWAHLLGGFLVIIGLLTRLAVLVQIPILAGAITFVNRPWQNTGEFFFAFAVLLLLILFFFKGGGLLSLDRYFKNNPV